MDKRRVIDILNAEMALATGCTEPAAIAFVSATAAERLNGEDVEKILVRVSGNMLKNAMAAGIPGTNYKGVEYASAIGAIGGESVRKLQIFDAIRPEALTRAERLVGDDKVTVELADVEELLYVDVRVWSAGRTARAVISGAHTHLALVEENGEIVFRDESAAEGSADLSPEEIRRILSIGTICEFVDSLDTEKDPIEILRESVEVNSAISDEGLKSDYGLKIGKSIREDQKAGIVGNDMIMEAVLRTAAGADARMAGAPFPVVSNSGSGNQGITTTMPVVTVAKWLNSGEDKLLRAVALSNLVAIYIKSKFGRLSALCGATVASTGAACGVTYLLGGGHAAIERAIQNMIGDVTGMVCDGAKADCALKIHSCTHAAMQAALMAVRGVKVTGTDGINEDDVEKTIDNFAALSSKGSSTLDSLILGMMLDKEKR